MFFWIFSIFFIHNFSRETVVSQYEQAFQFSHEQISKEFIYWSDSNKIYSEANFGGKIEDNEYALVGPFTTWRIELDTSYSSKKSIIDAVKDHILQKDMGIEYPGKSTLTVASITPFNEQKVVKIELQNIVGSIVKTLNINALTGTVIDAHTSEDLTDKNIAVILSSNREVDLSELEAIELEFTGKYYPFSR